MSCLICYPSLLLHLCICAPIHANMPPYPHRNLFDYDQVVNTQRDKIYAERRRAVLSNDLAPLMVEYAERTVDDILEVRRPGASPMGFLSS